MGTLVAATEPGVHEGHRCIRIHAIHVETWVESKFKNSYILRIQMHEEMVEMMMFRRFINISRISLIHLKFIRVYELSRYMNF